MRARSRLRRSGIRLLAGVAVFLSLPAVRAHELGALHVEAQFTRDANYRLKIAIGTSHLPPAERPSAGNPAAERALVTRALAAMTIEFDGEVIHPRVDQIASVDGGAVAQLSGAVPPGAASFQFRSDLPLGQFLIGLRNEGSELPVYEWLEPGAMSTPFPLAFAPPPLTVRKVCAQYLRLGFTHIVPHGLDHILFVCGLFLLGRRWKPLLWQVTAFTVAHSITLALAMYGVVRLPSSVVEPLIALSIAYIAIENLLLDRFRAWRVAVVFTFGLLHGLGFAGVLTELGLPRAQFVPALVSFNAGVELGQLTVLCGALILVALPFSRHDWYRARVTVPASVVIALIGIFWTVQRIATP